MDGVGDRLLETDEYFRNFTDTLNDPSGSPENLAGNLIQELLALSLAQFGLLREQYPQYSEVFEQARNQGKSQSEPSIQARTLAALLKDDHPNVDVSTLITIVRKIQEQS